MKRWFFALAAVIAGLPGAGLPQQANGISREGAIRVAANALKEECSAPVECQFSASRVEGGWSVLVWFCRRNESGGCQYVLGGSDNKFVFVRDDGTLKGVTGT